MSWGTKQNIPYAFHILIKDRDNVLDIIKEGLFKKIPENYFDEQKNNKYYETAKLCNTINGIFFTTLIYNVIALEKYITDSRGTESLMVVFGESNIYAEFSDAKSMMNFYSD